MLLKAAETARKARTHIEILFTKTGALKRYNKGRMDSAVEYVWKRLELATDDREMDAWEKSLWTAALEGSQRARNDLEDLALQGLLRSDIFTALIELPEDWIARLALIKD
jgi:hypothetical protein